MRRVLIAVLVLAVAGSAFAVTKTDKTKRKTVVVRQPVERVEYDRPVRVGWYVSPALKFGEIKGDVETFVGIRAGLEFNRSFYIGVAGYGLPEDRFNDYYHDYFFEDDEWAMGYGGVELGVISGRPRNGQIALGVLIGGGSVNIDEHYFYDYDGFFIMEPQLDLMVGLGRNVRLGLGAGYRIVDDLESVRYTEDDLDGATFNISLSIGRF